MNVLFTSGCLPALIINLRQASPAVNGTKIRGHRVDDKERQKFLRLFEHAVALEIELARYASKYGVTDEARRLLADSPLGEAPGS
jgi:hypothetical protein